MRHSAISHRDGAVCGGYGRTVAAGSAAPLYGGGDNALFSTGLTSTLSFSGEVASMDRSVPPAFGRYDPPPTPATFMSPAGFFPSATAAGDVLYCNPPHHVEVQATPPYYVGDRRLPAEMVDCATGVYGGLTTPMQYCKNKMAATDSPADDQESSRHSILYPGDGLMQSPAGLPPPPPPMFGWRGCPTSCSTSAVKRDPIHNYPAYTGIFLDQPSCRSPVGADPAVEMCESHLANSAANMVRPMPRETRRRVADRSTSAAVLDRRPRTNFSVEQLSRLRQCFTESQYIDVHQRAKISAALGLSEKQVKIWFQNQRSKMKRLQRTGSAPSDNVAFSHVQQQAASIATVVKPTDAGVNNDNNPARLSSLLSSPNKTNTVSWHTTK